MESTMHNTDYRNVITLGTKFDILITDVPYGINAGEMPFIKHQNSPKQKSGNRLTTPKKNYSTESWDNEVPDQEYFDLMKKVSDNQIIFGVDYVNWEGMGDGRIKWNKGVAEGMSFKSFERAYCSMIDFEYEVNYLWSGMMQGKSPLQPMVMQGNKKLNEKRIHPCHKPVIMWFMLLTKFATPGMVILDTHAGSGSLRIACAEFGCGYVGCEISTDTFNRQEKRWNQYKSKLKMKF